MPETLLLTILGIAGTLLSGIVMFVLGRHAERQKQTFAIRAEMLKPIDEWLKGTEKMVSILGDTMASIALNMRLPVNYDFDERRKASIYMAEKTNEILGIISSNSLRTWKTGRLAKELNETIKLIDQLVKFQLLPRESEIVGRSNNGTLTEEFMLEAGQLKMYIDSLLQKAYSLIAQIKTTLT